MWNTNWNFHSFWLFRSTILILVLYETLTWLLVIFVLLSYAIKSISTDAVEYHNIISNIHSIKLLNFKTEKKYISAELANVLIMYKIIIKVMFPIWNMFNQWTTLADFNLLQLNQYKKKYYAHEKFDKFLIISQMFFSYFPPIVSHKTKKL